jgi:hypothetical protein
MFWRRKGSSDSQVPPAQHPGDAVPEAETRGAAPPPERVRVARSPRAALEPERVRAPRSSSAKHPMVVAGSAFFTILVVLALGIGGAVLVGKEMLGRPGPLTQDKVVNIPTSMHRDPTRPGCGQSRSCSIGPCRSLRESGRKRRASLQDRLRQRHYRPALPTAPAGCAGAAR